jgi:hypothetical protein
MEFFDYSYPSTFFRSTDSHCGALSALTFFACSNSMACTANETQSQLIAVTPSGDHLGAIMRSEVEAPPYEELVNFPRAKDKDEIRCVMCGLPPGVSCVIPRQNKDVCKDCDKSTWLHAGTGVYFKWCKGCKRFHNILMFREKLQLLRESGKKQLTKLPSKCDPCRQRGRLGYRSKKVLGFVFNSFFFLQTHR